MVALPARTAHVNALEAANTQASGQYSFHDLFHGLPWPAPQEHVTESVATDSSDVRQNRQGAKQKLRICRKKATEVEHSS